MTLKDKLKSPKIGLCQVYIQVYTSKETNNWLMFSSQMTFRAPGDNNKVHKIVGQFRSQLNRVWNEPSFACRKLSDNNSRRVHFYARFTQYPGAGVVESLIQKP